jgi:hypothetical protein
VSIGKISLEANMNEFADDQVTKRRYIFDKNERVIYHVPYHSNIKRTSQPSIGGRIVCINLKVRLFS